MKNIHVIKTENTSRLLLSNRNHLQFLKDNSSTNPNNNFGGVYVHIYITCDEEIKAGDYFWKPDCNMIFKAEYTPHKGCQKVILTTDQDLIADGIQVIDDEFLEKWSVMNPSCEEVEFNAYPISPNGNIVGTDKPYPFDGLVSNFRIDYKILIPKEEPKQLSDLEVAIKLEEIERETLEEVAEKLTKDFPHYSVRDNMDDSEIKGWFLEALQKGAKWQTERSYSEQEILTIIKAFDKDFYQGIVERNGHTNKWFEQFKKK